MMSKPKDYEKWEVEELRSAVRAIVDLSKLTDKDVDDLEEIMAVLREKAPFPHPHTTEELWKEFSEENADALANLGKSAGADLSGVQIRYAETEDADFWFAMDRHLPQNEFENKVSNRQGYVLLAEERIAGILRYNLFWDNTPFCTFLYVDKPHRGKGYGSALMEFWEQDMKAKGFGMLMTSTQVDEDAQHFYRKLGYKDAGGFVVDIPGFEQPMELILLKGI